MSRVVDRASEGIPTRHGGKVAPFTVSDGDAAAGRIHAKVYKWWNTESAGVNGTYRAWYYVPRGYGWRDKSWGTNILQWKEEYTGVGGEFRQEPQWALARRSDRLLPRRRAVRHRQGQPVPGRSGRGEPQPQVDLRGGQLRTREGSAVRGRRLLHFALISERE